MLRTFTRSSRTLVLVLAAGLVGAAGLRAEEAGKELERLRERVADLEAAHLRSLEALEARIDELEEELLAPPPAPPAASGQRLNVFNPRITAFGNVLGRADDRRVENDAGAAIDDRINLREVELDFRSAVDPWANAVVITTFDAETPGRYDAGIEEGYLVLKRLPVVNAAPLGLRVVVGRFRPALGRFNRTHLHDLPFPDYPLALQRFLGEEGLVRNGGSGRFYVPNPMGQGVLEGDVTVMNGGGIPVAAGNPGGNVAWLGHLKWFTDLAPGHDLEIGGSAWRGRTDGSSDATARLYGFDATYKWKPMGGGEWRSFLAGGELFAADVDGAGHRPWGGYLWSQVQLNRQTYLGARYDRVEEPGSGVETRGYGGYLSYYTTEFLRLRAGWEHRTSDDPAVDGHDTALVEVNFVLGSHPVEPYWVNR